MPHKWESYKAAAAPALKEHSRGRARGGLLTLHDEKHVSFMTLETNHMFMLSLCSSADLKFILGSVYLRTEDDLGAALSLLQVSLEEVRQRYPDLPIILGGDYNARVGSDTEDLSDVLEGTRLLPTSELLDDAPKTRGTTLSNFMRENGFILVNGRTVGDNPGQFTFVGHQGRSTIDLIYVNIDCTISILDLVVLPFVSLSDHLPVCLSLACCPLVEPPANGVVHQNLQPYDKLCWDKSKQNEFSQVLVMPPVPDHLVDTAEVYNILKDSIYDAAGAVGMMKSIQPRASRKSNARWFDSDCVALMKTLADSLKLALSNNFCEPFNSAYLSYKKQYKRTQESKKLEYEQSIRDRFSRINCPTDFWSAYRLLKRNNFQINGVSLPEWERFYANIFPPRSAIDRRFCDSFDPLLDSPITLDELKSAIDKCEPNKAPGPDGISSNFLKALPPSGLDFLLDFYNKILSQQKFPKALCKSSLTLLHKKGDVKNPRNYRGIALLNLPLKAFTMIINNRLSRWSDFHGIIPESQSGFRKTRSFMDNIFVLQSCLQLQIKNGNKNLYGLFVDFERAFDSVPHAKLLDKLYRLGCSARVVNLIGNLYEQAEFNVRIDGAYSNDIQVTEGVLQGEVLSPLLFSLFISDIETHLRNNGLEGVSMNAIVDILILLFADDIVLLARSPVILDRILRSLEKYCTENCLKLNTNKTKVVHFRKAGRPRLRTFVYNNVELEIVNSYVYLGVVISSSTLGLRAATSAISKTKVALGTTLSICSNAKIDFWPARVKLFDSIVSATLLYCAPMWGLLYVDLIEKIQMEFYKRLLNVPITTANYLLRLELDLRKLSLNVLSATINYIVRVLQMPDDRYPKVCLLRQFDLYSSNPVVDKFVWLSHLRLFLEPINLEHLLFAPDHNTWITYSPAIIQRYGDHLKLLDLIAYDSSTSFNLRIPRTFCDGSAFYLSTRMQFYFHKIMAQIRLSPNRFLKFNVKNFTYTIDPTVLCSICNLNVPESLRHLLLECPIYSASRNHFLLPILNENHLQLDELVYLGLVCEPSKIKAIAFYMTNCLRTRSFCINE